MSVGLSNTSIWDAHAIRGRVRTWPIRDSEQMRAIVNARVGLFQGANESRGHSLNSQEADKQRLQQLAVLQHRRDYWLRLLDGLPSDSVRAPASTSNGILEIWLGTIVLVLLLAAVSMPIISIPLAVLLILLIIRAVYRHILRSRMLVSLREELCSGCMYPLRGLGELPTSAGAARLGPSRCPECGCPWPLVPSPGKAGRNDSSGVSQ